MSKINSVLRKLSEERRELEPEAHAIHKGKVSICIPNFNKVKWIEACLDSVANQTYKNIEIIVVDDCSTDGSQNKIIKLQDKYLGQVKVVVMMLPRRVGTAWAQNIAYYLAKGEYFANCDSDDVYHPEKIEKQLSLLKEQDLDLVGTNFDIFSASPLSPTVSDGGYWLKYEPETIQDSYLFNSLHCVCFGTLLFKSKVIEKICGMNKDFIGTEDYEFVDRAAKNGFRIGNCREVLYHYRSNNTQRSKLFHKS